MTETTKGSLCFVAPRFPDNGAVGGAETLLLQLAQTAHDSGYKITFLTTCARSHFTWANEIPPGQRDHNGLDVHYFPVDENRDIDTFLHIQQSISMGRTVSDEQEEKWLRNNVNSSTLCQWLKANAGSFDRILTGPYLFGLIEAVSHIAPDKTILVPCLHDEPFARVRRIRQIFSRVHGCIFNTDPERDLAERIFGTDYFKSCGVVGMGIEPFEADPQAFAAGHNITSPYIVYCGRRELLKGTPLLLDYINLFRLRTSQDIKLVLTGSGDIEPPPELKGHIIDCGFVTEKEKQEAMAGAAAFCHPSINESLGIVLLESWLAYTPVLVHAKGDVLRHQCRISGGGLWFNDYPEFEAELSLLLESPETNAFLAESGRQFVIKEYSHETVLRKLLNAIKK